MLELLLNNQIIAVVIGGIIGWGASHFTMKYQMSIQQEKETIIERAHKIENIRILTIRINSLLLDAHYGNFESAKKYFSMYSTEMASAIYFDFKEHLEHFEIFSKVIESIGTNLLNHYKDNSISISRKDIQDYIKARNIFLDKVK